MAAADTVQPTGRIAENIMHFSRVLRRAGLPVGPGAVLRAIEAVDTVGFARRDDFYWTLQATLVSRRDHREVFDQAFHVFWRNPKLLERMVGLLLPEVRLAAGQHKPAPGTARVADAFARTVTTEVKAADQDVEIDARFTYADRELLREKDFEQMSADELAAARAALLKLDLPIREHRTRRFKSSDRMGAIDMRRTLAATLRQGGDLIALKRRRRRTEQPPLVVLCDISGSMGEYTRLFLHFMYALMATRRRVHVFLFGTRLTNITRQLGHRDVDEALSRVGEAVEDWAGGTRIGACLRAFHLDWSRRVLGQGAVVLLLTDGLERAQDSVIADEAARLHRSCRRLIWLNPLLRYDRFEARASGIRALLPHVDEFRPVHNLNSIAALAEALSSTRASTRASTRGQTTRRAA